jgi:hypothetical protein
MRRQLNADLVYPEHAVRPLPQISSFKTFAVQKTVELDYDVTTMIIVRDIAGRLLSPCS